MSLEASLPVPSADMDVASFIKFKLFSFPRLETLPLKGLHISELVAVAQIFKLLIYSGDFVENGKFIAKGLPMSHFAPFLTKLSIARLQQG